MEIERHFIKNVEGWPTTTIRESCSYRNGKAHEPFVTEQGPFRLVTSKFVSSEGKLARRVSRALTPLNKGEVAFVLSDLPNGRTLGKAYLVNEEEDLTLNQRVIAVSSEQFDSTFLFHQLNRNPHFLKFDNGESQTHLKLAQVLECPLVCPPLPVQNRIGTQLEEVTRSVSQYMNVSEIKEQQLDALRSGILSSAFAGAL